MDNRARRNSKLNVPVFRSHADCGFAPSASESWCAAAVADFSEAWLDGRGPVEAWVLCVCTWQCMSVSRQNLIQVFL